MIGKRSGNPQTVRAIQAYGRGEAVQYLKSDGRWVTVSYPKFVPTREYRPASEAPPALESDEQG